MARVVAGRKRIFEANYSSSRRRRHARRGSLSSCIFGALKRRSKVGSRYGAEVEGRQRPDRQFWLLLGRLKG